MNIPQNVLRQLMCSLCGGYLNSSPIMVKNDNAQICGKCFKILPEEERTKYVRQIGLEAVSEMLIFPCRYNLEGCKSEFLWNNGIDHEAVCPHRHNILNKDEINQTDTEDSCDTIVNSDINRTKLDFSRENENCALDVNYFLYKDEKSDSFHCLEFSMKIIASPYNNLPSTVINKESGTKANIQIHVEGAISLLNPPKTIYGDIKMKSGVENIYATIETSDTLQHTGDVTYGKQTKGQIYSRSPNGNAKNCVSYFDSVQRYVDLKANKETVKSHQCPLSNCVFSGTTSEMQTHLETSHSVQTVTDKTVTKSVSKSDCTWFMLCFDDIFKCTYYHYGHGSEFVVVYLGDNNNSKRFKFEIDIPYRTKFNKQDRFKKRRPCIGWNEFALDSGVFIEHEILSTYVTADNKLKFTLNIIPMT